MLVINRIATRARSTSVQDTRPAKPNPAKIAASDNRSTRVSSRRPASDVRSYIRAMPPSIPSSTWPNAISPRPKPKRPAATATPAATLAARVAHVTCAGDSPSLTWQKRRTGRMRRSSPRPMAGAKSYMPLHPEHQRVQDHQHAGQGPLLDLVRNRREPAARYPPRVWVERHLLEPHAVVHRHVDRGETDRHDGGVDAQPGIQAEELEYEIEGAFFRPDLERHDEQHILDERCEPADHVRLRVRDVHAYPHRDEHVLEHEDRSADVLERERLNKTTRPPVVKVRNLLIHLRQRRPLRLEAACQGGQQRNPVHEVEQPLETTLPVTGQEQDGQRRQHRERDAQGREDRRAVREQHDPQGDRREETEQHPERVENLIDHDGTSRSTQTEPRGDRGDPERLATHVHHRRHEVQREPRGEDRIGRPKGRGARLVGHGDQPGPAVAGIHHAVEEKNREEQPAGLRRVREQPSHADPRDEIRTHSGAQRERQQLEFATHTPPGIATVLPVRAAAYASSTTPAARRLSSTKGPVAAIASARSSAATNASNRQANQRWYAVFSSSAEKSWRSTRPARSSRSSPPAHSIDPPSPTKRIRFSRVRAAHVKNMVTRRAPPEYSNRREAVSSTSYPVCRSRPVHAPTALGRPAISSSWYTRWVPWSSSTPPRPAALVPRQGVPSPPASRPGSAATRYTENSARCQGPIAPAASHSFTRTHTGL